MLSIATTFRTDDVNRWGLGKAANLTAAEVDNNFWELKSAIENLIAHPPSPIEIAAFGLNGSGLTISMTNGNILGPIPLPVLSWRWRDEWTMATPYAQLDVFKVTGTGIFLVLVAHTSAGSFDPLAVDGMSNPLYKELFGTAIGATGGTAGQILRKLSSADFATAWQDSPMPVSIFMPGVPAGDAIARVALTEAGQFAADFAGSFGPAKAASTGTAVVTIRINSTIIGTATYTASVSPVFATSAHSAKSFIAGDVAEFAFPSSPDSTLADIAMSLRATRS